MAKSLRTIRQAFWRRLIIFAIAYVLIAAAVTALFWRAIPQHTAFIGAIALAFGIAFAVTFMGFLYLYENLINPLIDLGRAARAQRLLGAPLDESKYDGTMVDALAEVLAHHEGGELARANTQEAEDWAHKIGKRRLRAMNFVVFDTETTGLEPQNDDEIIQIGAVRVKAGKVDTQDYFASYAKPSRPIPRSSTKIHGIDDRRVSDAAPTKEVVQRFHDWAADDVLVAHNAAFDMAFLRKTGVVFEHYILDTVYMSAHLFDHTGTHTLDALSERLHVQIPEQLRHDAHGDAVGTAEVFAKLIVLLEERGIVTLDDAIDLGKRMRRIRRAQAIYG